MQRNGALLAAIARTLPLGWMKIGAVDVAGLDEVVQRQEHLILRELADPGQVHLDDVVGRDRLCRIREDLATKLVHRERLEADARIHQAGYLVLQIAGDRKRRIIVERDAKSTAKPRPGMERG